MSCLLRQDHGGLVSCGSVFHQRGPPNLSIRDSMLFLRTWINWCLDVCVGYTHLGIKGLSGEYITHTDRALPPFAPPDSTTLTESESYQLPDIYPISPLIDLKKQHVWRHEDVAGKSLNLHLTARKPHR